MAQFRKDSGVQVPGSSQQKDWYDQWDMDIPYEGSAPTHAECWKQLAGKASVELVSVDDARKVARVRFRYPIGD